MRSPAGILLDAAMSLQVAKRPDLKLRGLPQALRGCLQPLEIASEQHELDVRIIEPFGDLASHSAGRADDEIFVRHSALIHVIAPVLGLLLLQVQFSDAVSKLSSLAVTIFGAGTMWRSRRLARSPRVSSVTRRTVSQQSVALAHFPSVFGD
jgi:hypothetical protein